jgi:hypothetical protein
MFPAVAPNAVFSAVESKGVASAAVWVIVSATPVPVVIPEDDEITTAVPLVIETIVAPLGILPPEMDAPTSFEVKAAVADETVVELEVVAPSETVRVA